MKLRIVHTKGATPLPISDVYLDSAQVSVFITQLFFKKYALAQY